MKIKDIKISNSKFLQVWQDEFVSMIPLDKINQYGILRDIDGKGDRLFVKVLGNEEPDTIFIGSSKDCDTLLDMIASYYPGKKND